MQHQSQDLSKGPTAGKTGILVSGTVITGAEIERHIAEGKRMQAEAIAAFLSAAFRRLAGLFHRRGASGTGSAMPHSA
ncbi:MAG: hypothetical protein Kow00114_30510 [Kiloniellaceae bacterium]